MIKKKGYMKVVGKCCCECSKFIDPTKDHYVQLSTWNREISPDDHQFFHFQCWVEYFKKCVENKMRANVSMMQEKAMGLFNSPAIKNLLSQVQGSEMALNMLSMPLNKVVSKKRVISKIHDVRKRKRSAKKRKA